MAPCAGITTFSPMQHWKLQPAQRVGIIRLGGLEHMEVKLAVAGKAVIQYLPVAGQGCRCDVCDQRFSGPKAGPHHLNQRRLRWLTIIHRHG